MLDFLSRSFTRGLPGLDASEAEAREADEVKLRRQLNTTVQAAGAGGRDGGENSEEFSHELLEVLEGPHKTFGSLTLFPGAQFILAQMVARPAFCYSVPAVRMSVRRCAIGLGVVARCHDDSLSPSKRVPSICYIDKTLSWFQQKQVDKRFE